MPYSRKYFDSKNLRNLQMVERNDNGVISGLHLLSARGKNGFYKFRFGTRSAYPESGDQGRVGVDNTGLIGCPPLPKLDFWDLLRAFKAHSKAGWDTEWQVGKDEYGLVRFYGRCSDIYDTFDRTTQGLLLDLLDPSKTIEPKEKCGIQKVRRLRKPVPA